MGPSIKYVTNPGGGGGGGLRKCDSLWQGGGRGGKDCVTSHFHFFPPPPPPRFILYFLIHNTSLSCNYHLRSCKKVNLQGVFQGLLETPNVISCYWLKIKYSNLIIPLFKGKLHFPYISCVNFLFTTCDILLGGGGGPIFPTVCDRG